ncbi:hypothetical protein SAMN02745178_00023 [Gemmiger formicilis]|uniref:Uncharacterized protein n=1 Tax=Gemmiger formicilis TaxID=745368 RepID=A0A1T4W6J2_9FIRM|nr:hypothetical protein SAMN02745178_00023 [Gemmiger formicilis]
MTQPARNEGATSPARPARVNRTIRPKPPTRTGTTSINKADKYHAHPPTTKTPAPRKPVNVRQNTTPNSSVNTKGANTCRPANGPTPYADKISGVTNAAQKSTTSAKAYATSARPTRTSDNPE